MAGKQEAMMNGDSGGRSVDIVSANRITPDLVQWIITDEKVRFSFQILKIFNYNVLILIFFNFSLFKFLLIGYIVSGEATMNVFVSVSLSVMISWQISIRNAAN